jgi:hypothetical protein
MAVIMAHCEFSHWFGLREKIYRFNLIIITLNSGRVNGKTAVYLHTTMKMRA